MGVELPGWILVAVRIFAILRAQALWRTAVGPVWPLAAAGLALMVAPTVAAGVSAEVTVVGVVVEALVGTAIGILVSLPGWALIGASAASAAVLRTSPRPMVGLALALVAATSLSLHLHQPMLLALRDSFVVLGPGAAGLPLAPAALARSLHAMTVLALSLATPVLLAAVVADVAARGLGRGPLAAGALTDAAAPWLRTGAALVALAASWQAYSDVWASAVVGP